MSVGRYSSTSLYHQCRSCLLRSTRRPFPFPASVLSYRTLTSAEEPFRNDKLQTNESVPDQISATRPRLSFGRVRKGKKNSYRESSQQLGTKRLGSPANIVLLRDAGIKRNESSPTLETKPAQEKSVIAADIIAAVQDGMHSATNREVYNLLEELKPKADESSKKATVYITQEEYRKLIGTLMDGFTAKQLNRYIITAKENAKSQDKEKWEVRQARKAFLWSDWQSGTTPMSERLVVIPQKKQSKKASRKSSTKDSGIVGPKEGPKEKLARRIVSEMWQTQVVEEIESVGQKELHLPEPWQVGLLQTEGGEQIMERISQSRLVSFAFHRDDQVIRITADKTRAEYAAGDVEQLLISVRQASFKYDLGLYADKGKTLGASTVQSGLRRLGQNDLNYAARLTRTHLSFASRSEILITAFEEHDIENAKRVLRSILGLPASPKSTLLGRQELLKHAMIHVMPSTFSLPYVDRRTKLGRWTLPIKRKPAQVTDHHDLESHSTDPSQGDALHERIRELLCEPSASAHTPVEDHGSSSPSALDWESSPRLEAIADFGYVLHHADTAENHWQMKHEQNFLEPRRMVFSPNAPALPRTLSVLASKHEPQISYYNYLVLRLIPEVPDVKGLYDIKSLPEIEMRWTLDDSMTEANFSGIRAYLRSETADVLLPNRATDVRFTRREVAWSSNMVLGKKQVKAFDDMVQESLALGEQLRAPPEMQLYIPSWFSTSADAEQSESPASTILVKFAPVNFEFRQRMAFNVDGHGVSFTTIDGGKVRGTSTRVRLSLAPMSNIQALDPAESVLAGMNTVEDDSTEIHTEDAAAEAKPEEFVDQVEHFINSAFAMNDLIHDSAQDGLPLGQLVKHTFSKDPNLQLRRFVYPAPGEAADLDDEQRQLEPLQDDESHVQGEDKPPAEGSIKHLSPNRTFTEQA